MSYRRTGQGWVVRVSDEARIACNESNSTYQQVLAWIAAGNTLLPPSAPELAELRATLAASVDNHIAGLYTRWTRFQAEYEKREQAARAFKAAGYSGDPGPYVSRFAQNTGYSTNQAANIIIAQADAMYAALEILGALRMDKYIILASDDLTAQATHDQIIAAANAAVEGL